MREHGLAGTRLRRRVRTTIPDQSGRRCPDLIGRDVSTGEPNRRYVGDITYLPVTYLPVEGGTNLYFASCIDLGSRKLTGWAMADHMRTELVVDALEAAWRARIPHRFGVPLGSRVGLDLEGVRRRLRATRVTQSMGAIGSSADNALAESFNATLKRELLASRSAFPDAATAYRAVSAGRTATTPGAATPRSAISARTPTKPLPPLPSRTQHNRSDTVSKTGGQGPGARRDRERQCAVNVRARASGCRGRRRPPDLMSIFQSHWRA